MIVEGTGSDFGLTGLDQIAIAAEYAARNGGSATMGELYQAVERFLGGNVLSDQGRSSLRFFINEVAVAKGYFYPYDRNRPGWHLTPLGFELARSWRLTAPQAVRGSVEDSGEQATTKEANSVSSSGVPTLIALLAMFEQFKPSLARSPYVKARRLKGGFNKMVRQLSSEARNPLCGLRLIATLSPSGEWEFDITLNP